MKKTSFWVILILIVAVISGAVVAWQYLGPARSGDLVANVYLDGECVRSIKLDQLTETETFTVKGPAGENVITAEPGRICVSHADCPDQVCVNMGWRSDGKTPIVCLPNKLVIRIEGSAAETEIDGVVG